MIVVLEPGLGRARAVFVQLLRITDNRIPQTEPFVVFFPIGKTADQEIHAEEDKRENQRQSNRHRIPPDNPSISPTSTLASKLESFQR